MGDSGPGTCLPPGRPCRDSLGLCLILPFPEPYLQMLPASGLMEESDMDEITQPRSLDLGLGELT